MYETTDSARLSLRFIFQFSCTCLSRVEYQYSTTVMSGLVLFWALWIGFGWSSTARVNQTVFRPNYLQLIRRNEKKKNGAEKEKNEGSSECRRRAAVVTQRWAWCRHGVGADVQAFEYFYKKLAFTGISFRLTGERLVGYLITRIHSRSHED